jgi:death-on-curing family protein
MDCGMRGCWIQRSLVPGIFIYLYEGADIVRLAADYSYGICQNHPFIDGNKRTAFVAMVASLKLNGYRFCASQLEVVNIMESLANGHCSEEETCWEIGENDRIGNLILQSHAESRPYSPR